jgi:iron(III) transport system permease protein
LLPETLPVGIAEAIPPPTSPITWPVREPWRRVGHRLVCAGFVLALLPIAFVVGVYLQTGWSTLVPLVFRPRVGELLVNTVLLVLSPFLCVLLWGSRWRG